MTSLTAGPWPYMTSYLIFGQHVQHCCREGMPCLAKLSAFVWEIGIQWSNSRVGPFSSLPERWGLFGSSRGPTVAEGRQDEWSLFEVAPPPPNPPPTKILNARLAASLLPWRLCCSSRPAMQRYVAALFVVAEAAAVAGRDRSPCVTMSLSTWKKPTAWTSQRPIYTGGPDSSVLPLQPRYTEPQVVSTGQLACSSNYVIGRGLACFSM